MHIGPLDATTFDDAISLRRTFLVGAAGPQRQELTARERRDLEQHRLRHRTSTITAVATDVGSGRAIASTELVIPRRRPTAAYHSGTVMVPDQRDQGVATQLKSSVMSWIRRERPDIAEFGSFNWSDNGAKLRVNESIGYQRQTRISMWQLATRPWMSRQGPCHRQSNSRWNDGGSQ